MLKKLPLFGAALALCACSSPPALKFPSGNSYRTPANAFIAPAAAKVNPQKNAAVAVTPKPEVVSVSQNDKTVMSTLLRWSLVARVPFTWSSGIDYPLTPQMRQIENQPLDVALVELRGALQGASTPLVITFDADGLVVKNREILNPIALLPAGQLVSDELVKPAAAVAAPSE